MTIALFQKGKEFVWEGLDLVMKVVDEAEVEAHKALGWVLHPYHTIEVPNTAPKDPNQVAPVPAPTPSPEQAPVVAPVAPAPEVVQTAEQPGVTPVNPFAPK